MEGTLSMSLSEDETGVKLIIIIIIIIIITSLVFPTSLFFLYAYF